LLPLKAVVLAPERGTRLYPLTEDTPKTLVELNIRPLIEGVFDNLAEFGVDEFVVVVGHLADRVIERYGEFYEEILISCVH